MPGTVHDTSCFYTTVKNTSGKSMVFGFLPPHGRRLAANATFSMIGDLTAAITRGDRSEGMRRLTAFQDAVGRGDIQVVATPTPIVIDATSHLPKMLKLTGGALSAVDPCWVTSVGSDPDIN